MTHEERTNLIRAIEADLLAACYRACSAPTAALRKRWQQHAADLRRELETLRN